MDFLFDPTVWVGLLALTVLEVVLGIDNLFFITILAEKLPPIQRNRARITGLVLAMVIRIILLAFLSWLVTLTQPLFTLFSINFTGRSLILLTGGIFLLFKASSELHHRIEVPVQKKEEQTVYPSFFVVVAQIVVLDAIFSIDSVVTAVGIVKHLPIMMVAIIISVGIMIWASKPLSDYLRKHPTVEVLCLSFLLMVGLSLITNGLGLHIPEGYLYAAIAFSLFIEFFNQFAQHKQLKSMAHTTLRDRTANAVLSLLGTKQTNSTHPDEKQEEDELPIVFKEEERDMVSGVLTLGERTVHSIMTPKNEISWINLRANTSQIQNQLRLSYHSYHIIADTSLNNVLGIARAQDIADDLHLYGKIVNEHIKPPIVIPESSGVLKAIEQFKKSRGQLALVVDEYGSIEGLITPIDILEAIAGEFPDENEQLSVNVVQDGIWDIDGTTDLYSVEQTLETTGLVDDNQEYSTLNGFLLDHFDFIPHPGQFFNFGGFRFEVLTMKDRRIITVRISKLKNSLQKAKTP